MVVDRHHGEQDRAGEGEAELEEVGEDDADQACEQRVRDRDEEETEEQPDALALVESHHQGEHLEHREVHPAHHDRVAQHAEVDRPEEAEPRCGPAAIAKLGQDAASLPQVTDEKGSHQDRENVGPPEPVAGDAAGRDESCDREGGVGREGGRDDGGARKPPGQRSIRREEGLRGTAGAPGVPGTPAEGDGQEEDDDREV